MNNLDDLLGMIPIDDVAGRLGVDPAMADGLVRRALPTLVSGMKANADDPGGATSLLNALGAHDGSVVDGGIDLDQVDVADGQKILGHVFGSNQRAVTEQLGGLGGGSEVMSKLLPLLAPIVLGWLAKQLTGSDDSPLGDLGGIGDLGGLGGLLGGDTSDAGSGGLSGVLGSLLKSELGGDGELDDVLGDLLGGGSRA
jgi:hypothetical protein